MKIRIEILGDLAEDEVVIRCRQMDESIQRIHRFISEQAAVGPKLVFYKEAEEFYLPLDEILFFETQGEKVYAHSGSDAYRIRMRLYELEEVLPKHFMRAAKGTIVNVSHIYSISKDLTSSSLVRFTGTHKQIFISRHYYRALKDRLNERSYQHG